MLFIDDQKVEFSQLANNPKTKEAYKEFSELFKKDIKKKRFTLVLREDYVHYNAVNKVREYAEYFIRFHETVLLDSGDSCKVIYAKHKTIKGTEPVYKPVGMQVNGLAVVSDLELAFFLYFASSSVAGFSKKGKRNYFEFENKAAKAAKEVLIEARAEDIRIKILHEKHRLPDEKLRQIAKALHVNDVDNLEIEEVQIALRNMLLNDTDGKKVEKFNSFYDVEGSPETMTIKVAIQDAIDNGIIGHLAPRREVYWRDEEGTKSDTIVILPPGKNWQEKFHKELELNPKMRDDFLKVVNSRK